MIPEQVVAEFRQRLADSGSTFLIVYTSANIISDEVTVKIGSNSSKVGIQALLSVLLTPTEEAKAVALNWLRSAHEVGANDRADSYPEQTIGDRDVDDFFKQLIPKLTIEGWENDHPAQG